MAPLSIEPPLAVDDEETTEVNVPVVVEVLENDSDPADAPLTVVGTTNPVNGGSADVDEESGTIQYM